MVLPPLLRGMISSTVLESGWQPLHCRYGSGQRGPWMSVRSMGLPQSQQSGWVALTWATALRRGRPLRLELTAGSAVLDSDAALRVPLNEGAADNAVSCEDRTLTGLQGSDPLIDPADTTRVTPTQGRGISHATTSRLSGSGRTTRSMAL